MAYAGEKFNPNHNGETTVYHLSSDENDEAELSTTILMALDSVPGYDAENSETVVFDHIDLDALDELFSQADGTSSRGKVTFPVANYQVTATAAGEITIREVSSSND